MISRTLSTSVAFARLFDVAPPVAEFAQSLYPLLVAHSDDFGREQGDLDTVKYRIHPRSPRSVEDFGLAMAALERVGLIRWYETKGKHVYQVVKFDDHQTGLHKRTKSKFPPPPGNSRKVPEVPSQLKGRELKRTKPNPTEEDQDQEPAVAVTFAHDKVVEISDTPNVRVLAALVRKNGLIGESPDDSEDRKVAAARAHLAYDGSSLESARRAAVATIARRES